jgi:hypothetical protein
MSRDELPRGVFAKGRRYYLVVAEGKRRIWHKLSRIADGLPALYAALSAKKAELSRAPDVGTFLPALIADWEAAVMPRHAQKTQADERRRDRDIAEAFALWTPEKLDAPAISEFLAQFVTMPRTFNAYRAQVRELMRFAEEKGRRARRHEPDGRHPHHEDAGARPLHH